MAIIRDELVELRDRFGDERRTLITDEEEEFTLEDLIAEEDMVITITHGGYIKRLSISSYRKQQRGGRGVIGMETKEDDFIQHLFIASTHDYIMFFTSLGKCYWIKVHEIPVGGRLAKGRHVTNMIKLEERESICAFQAVRRFEEGHYVVMATKMGVVKKTDLTAFSNPRRDGIRAINIVPGEDELIDASITDGSNDVVLATRQGKAIRFPESKVRSMGRTAYGVKGINLFDDDYVVSMVVIRRASWLLTVTEHGYGKRSAIEDYRITNRGGKGIINIKTSERNGAVVAVKEVVESDELMIITHKGIIIRMPIKDIRSIGRATQGVKLISLSQGDLVIDVARVVTDRDSSNDVDQDNGSASAETGGANGGNETE
jgi:DNA gyrase subunit A